MDCPVCKYPNPSGATHCGMCYEVFRRSAAQTYLRAVRRARQIETEQHTPAFLSQIENAAQKGIAFLVRIDWMGLGKIVWTTVLRYKKLFAFGALGVFLPFIIPYLFSPSLHVALRGHHLTTRISKGMSLQYLVGFRTDRKSWSERQGRMDTPLEEGRLNEMGSIRIKKNAASNKNLERLDVAVGQWIQILADEKRTQRRSISSSDPSVAAGVVMIDWQEGTLTRRAAPTSRLGKSILFLFPQFPPGSLRPSRRWNERVEWVEPFGDWTIVWTGIFTWTLQGLTPCGKSECSRLTYEAELTPRLKSAPSWATGVVGRPRAEGLLTRGEALFDGRRRVLVSNTFSYQGALVVPIHDLGHIPRTLRVGRRVSGVSGDLVVHFKNKIDLHLNAHSPSEI